MSLTIGPDAESSGRNSHITPVWRSPTPTRTGVSQTICYEQPLNERIRSLLRFEFLFGQINYLMMADSVSVLANRAALQSLLDLLTLTGRNEFKGDLLKELERHAATLNRLRTNPQVHSSVLDQILEEIGAAIQQIRQLDTLTLDAVRQTDFLSAVYKRSQTPGSPCQFDMPALHYWLHQAPEIRIAHLRHWLGPLIPLGEGVTLLLHLIRNSTAPHTETAQRGFFQSNLDSSTPYQLIRVSLPGEIEVFPEISSGRHRFTIRFMEQPDPNRRPAQSAVDICFDLACCAI